MRSAGVDAQLGIAEGRWGHKPIVRFGQQFDLPRRFLKLKKCNAPTWGELCPYGTTDKIGEMLLTQREVLLDLRNAEEILPAFRLYREDIVGTPIVNSDVDLISLNLT